MNLVIETIAYLCECMMQLMCIHAFLGKKIKFDLKTVVVILLNVLISTLVINLRLPNTLTMLTHIVFFIYIILQFKIKVLYDLVLVILELLLGGSIQLLVMFPISFISEYVSNHNILGLLINIFSLLLMILFLHNIKVNKIYLKVIKFDKLIAIILSIVSIMFIYLFVIYKVDEKMDVVPYFICGIMICIVIKLILDWQKERYTMNQKLLELKMHDLYGKTFEGMIENIRIRQHDFKNQIAAIYGMHLTVNNFEELVEKQKMYCDYLVAESKYDSILTKCNDRILAGFLYTKFNETEKKGIKIDFDICINDSKCTLATYEIIELVGILIDNAVEYELEHMNDKQIYFVCKEYSDYINIVCKNKTEYLLFDEISNFFKKGYSTKGKNRGLGLYKLKNMLENNGDISVSNNDNYLEFDIKIKKL